MVRPSSSASQVVDPAQNQLSHYYVHPGENTSAALVTPLLTGRNYHSWARSMRRAMITMNKLKFLDGSLPAPDGFDPSYDAWERCKSRSFLVDQLCFSYDW